MFGKGFLCLDNNMTITNVACMMPSHSEIPKCNEGERTLYLYEMLRQYWKQKPITIEMYTNPGFNKAITQFTGGGDITLVNNNLCATIRVNQDTPCFGAVLEHKVRNKEMNKIKGQVIADTICVLGKSLQTSLLNNNRSVISCNRIIGYGLFLSSMGDFGLVRVTFEFGSMETKYEISPFKTYQHSYAVLLFDAVLEHLVEIMTV